MSLRIKFNLVMTLAFGLGLGLAFVLVDVLTQQIARQSVLSEASLMMDAVNATVHYTDKQVSPLLSRPMKVQFLPQAIPFYAAQRSFDGLSKQRPEYTLRQPVQNPTNLADRPMVWENDIIRTFQTKPDLKSLITNRKTALGDVISLSQPVKVDSESCLACHSTPQAAPTSLTDVYGDKNGFGWKLGDTVGAQIVSVPQHVASDQARHTLYRIMIGLFVVLLSMLLTLNVLLHLVIIGPVRRISHAADEISLGNMETPEFKPTSRDEIGSLAVSINRMRRSLTAAFRMLETAKS